MCTFLYKSDLNEILNQSLTDLYLINHLTNYRANIVHQKEAIYELFKELKIVYVAYIVPI